MAEQLVVARPRSRVRGALGRLTVADWAPALVLTAFAQLNLRFGLDGSAVFGSSVEAACVTAVATGVLVLRRRLPLTTVVVVAAALALPELVSMLTITLWGGFVPLLVAVYSIARHADRNRAAAGLLVAVAAIVTVMLRLPVIGTPGNIPFTGVPLLAVFVTGRVLRHRASSHRALERTALELEQQRSAQIEQAIADERARIARELHDLVAHSVSVMVVQAGAAEDLLDRDAAAAKEPLRVVQETGRQAVRELSTMLGLLRRPPGPVELEPQPDATRIPALVERIRASGLPVELRIDDDLPPLPPAVGLAVFRVAQEALTNALKHAPGGRATLTLRADAESVRLEVTNTAGSRPADGSGTGNGLVGIRERVAVHGGAMEAGPTAEGGFRVLVVLPLADGAAR